MMGSELFREMGRIVDPHLRTDFLHRQGRSRQELCRAFHSFHHQVVIGSLMKALSEDPPEVTVRAPMRPAERLKVMMLFRRLIQDPFYAIHRCVRDRFPGSSCIHSGQQPVKPVKITHPFRRVMHMRKEVLKRSQDFSTGTNGDKSFGSQLLENRYVDVIRHLTDKANQ